MLGDNPMVTAQPMISAKKCGLTLGWLAALIPCVAAAALGEPETSVSADAVRMRGSLKLTERVSYRQHEIRLPSGTLLREFVGSDGKVFAVAWNGPTMPDLRQALGRYFDSFAAAAKVKHAGHSLLQLRQSDLVVVSSGHMRAFVGRAYLPLEIPGGVELGELR
jgi:hypothetical protein